MGENAYEQAAALGELIARSGKQIEDRWLERVQRDIAGAPGVELTQLRDGMPDYLRALGSMLRGAREDRWEKRGRAAWSNVAREHGVTRVRIGFDINQLVHEFVVLRQVISEHARQCHCEAEGAQPLLADLLDAAIAASVQAYVDARDYDARRKQAENIGFVTHELRNPLSNAVMAVAQLVKQATPEQVPLFENLQRSHKRLTEMIESVLHTQKLDAGRAHSRPVDVELGEVMDGALQAARSAAEQKGLAFHTNYDPKLVIHVDPNLTRSALQNIADNAAKYTDTGHVDVTVERDHDQIVFHVRDTCLGLSQEELDTIFEPFERGNSGKSGTGLGLTIARRAVEAQGGSLHAESPHSSGCHFWFSLPTSRG